MSLAPNYIVSIGVELEGGIRWSDLELIRKKYDSTNRYDDGHDGSVHVSNPNNYYDWVDDVEIKYWSYDINDVLQFAKYVWSLGFKQNSSCGNHHHFRFIYNELLVTEVIASKEFIEMFQREFTEKFGARDKYYKRIDSRWCKFYYTNDDKWLNDQIIGNWYLGDRYKAINFRSLVDYQKTLEIRIMPFAQNYFEWRSQLMFNYNTINKIINVLLTNRELKFELELGTIEDADIIPLTPEEGVV